MADRIQLDGKTYMPLMEAAAMAAVSEKQVMTLAQSGRVFLRAIGKKVYVDIDGLQTVVRADGVAPAPAMAVPQPVVKAPIAPSPVIIPQAPIVPRVAEVPRIDPLAQQSIVAPAQQPIANVPTTPVPVTVAPVVRAVSAPVVPPVHMPPHHMSSAELSAMAPMEPLVVTPQPHHLSSAELSAISPKETSVTPPVPPAPQAQPQIPAQAQPNPLPRMVLPPKQFSTGVGRSFATSAAALAAFVFVIGGGITAYEHSPALARLVGNVGEQVAAVVSFGNTATYQAIPGTLGNSPLENSPSEQQASGQASTIPVAVASSSQPIYYVYNYPVIERVRTEVQYIDAENPQDFAQQLEALYQRIQTQIQGLNITTNTQFAQQYQVIAQTNNIDKLGSVTIENSTFSGGTVTGSTLTDIASLSVSGGTTLGGLTVGDITASGGGTFSGAGSFSYITASSTSATSTFNGGILATRAPTVPHTFASWTTGAANSAAFDAALVINPSSAVADSNLFSAMVNGSVKFLIDAEGDVFVNNLTSVGSVTLSTTSASTFTVEGNTTLGDSITDTTTINGTLVVTGTTTASTISGKFGVGTTTPWAKLAVQATAGQTYPIFELASSSSDTSYLTVTSSGNVGVGTSSPMWQLAVNNASGNGSIFAVGSNQGLIGAYDTQSGHIGSYLYSASGYSGIATVNNAGTFTGTPFSWTATNLGIGTTTPFRTLSVTAAVATAQAALSYDTTRNTDLLTDSSGDFVLNPSGDDVRINDDNLWVCAGGACPSGTPSGNGNLVVETALGVGTSTPVWPLTASHATLPQLSLTDASATSDPWTFRSIGSSLYIATSTYSATSTQPAITITPNGFVGIGTTSPSQQLSAAGLLFVGANGAAGMGTATSTFYGDIKIIGKLDVSTIDPVYTIDGIKYATYGHSTVGIKEEVTLKVTPPVWNAEKQMYAYVIDFDSLERGSDLWLFYQVTDFGKQWKSLVTSLTPSFDGRVYYEEDAEENTLTVYASESAPISVRLIASRFDFSKWANVRPDQDGDTAGTHVIEEKQR